jgi:hydroxyacylglutathione hydrolase
MSSLYVKQFVDASLGNSSYLVASTETGLAAVIDPQRDIDRYVRAAEGLGLQLAFALDTHLHADFVSGARELAAQSNGAFRIGASAQARVGFEHLPLSEGDTLSLGDVSIGVLTTPGHTPEHISFTAAPIGSPAPHALFSGGALIVGGAGRTDLLGHDLSEPLAQQLYHTLHHKLLHLPDQVTVYPTHGAGSFCNAPASPERVTTIGRERSTNRLAQINSEEEFVRAALSDLPSYPTYYRYMRAVNRNGPRVLGGVPGLKPLPPEDVCHLSKNGAVVIDVRSPREFAAGHIPDSYGVPLIAPLNTWVGWVVPFGLPLILVADDPLQREEAVRELIRIGYDDLLGYLDGGIAAWEAAGAPVRRTPLINVPELHEWLQHANAPVILDVRFEHEWRDGHLPNALHIEAGHVRDQIDRIPRDRPVVIYCGAANRATISASLLEQRGYTNVTVLDTGFNQWREAGYAVVEEARESQLLQH